jgi:competence protein ComEA
VKARIALGILAIGLLIASGCSSGGTEIVIFEPTTNLPAGTVYIGGEVNNPGYYPLREEDTIPDLIGAAGGVANQASEIKLIITSETDEPQKININTAELWLLEALPGIGEVKARAIISYREANGLFKSTTELLLVEGIGTSIYEKIKDLVSVGEP